MNSYVRIVGLVAALLLWQCGYVEARMSPLKAALVAGGTVALSVALIMVARNDDKVSREAVGGRIVETPDGKTFSNGQIAATSLGGGVAVGGMAYLGASVHASRAFITVEEKGAKVSIPSLKRMNRFRRSGIRASVLSIQF
jgi:hypothetical protein